MWGVTLAYAVAVTAVCGVMLWDVFHRIKPEIRRLKEERERWERKNR